MLLLLAWVAPSFAADRWQVIEAGPFRVLFPEDAADFAELTARRLPALHAAVEAEVGQPLEARVDLLIHDPWSQPNGGAFPLGDSPRMELWAYAPEAEGALGHYTRWGDVLFAHEDAHLVHLGLRPRNLSGRVLFALFGIGPVLRKSPPWLMEGYATLVEGRVTGSGRPHGAWRETVLRRLAQHGRLPAYGSLSGRYRYLVASAFLEWLDHREGGDSLKRVWRRLTAKRRRTVPEAFRGVYGERLSDLYARFRAEVTARALAEEGAAWRRETAWSDLPGPTHGLQLAPDGERLAYVTRPDDGWPELRVVAVAVDEAAEERRADRIGALIESDPLDVAPRDPLPPHRRLHTWRSKTHAPSHPRWVDDTHLVFDALGADGSGRFRRDLYVLDLERGRIRRLTHGADLRSASPTPAGDRVVGVTSRWGLTGLTSVDLRTGATTPITPLRADIVVDQPRPGPGGRLAWLENRGEGFGIRVEADGLQRTVRLPEGAEAVSLAWDGEALLASLERSGRLDVWRYDERWTRLTDTGGAYAPTAGPDAVFHLELDPIRPRIHRVPRDRPALSEGPGPVAVERVDLPETPVESRPYGLGRVRVRLLGSGMMTMGGSTVEMGLLLGDLVGRHQVYAAALVGDGYGQSGTGAWWVDRVLAVEVTTRAWALSPYVGAPLAPGASVDVLAETGTPNTSGSVRAGVWGTGGTDPLAAVWVESAAGWLEPRTRHVWAWAGLDAQAGVGPGSFVYGSAHAGLELGRPLGLGFAGSARITAGRPLSLGGATNSVQPMSAQWNRLRPGWALPLVEQAPGALQAEVWLGHEELHLAVERVVLGGAPWSWAGLRARIRREGDPLNGLPTVDVESGLGCAVEQGGAPAGDACRKLEDLRLWARMHVVP